MSRLIQSNSTSQSIRLFIKDSSTGSGKTGLAFDTSGLILSYSRGNTDGAHVITKQTQTPTGAWTIGGFCEVDATNQPGVYRLDIPNASVATAAGIYCVSICWTGTGILSGQIEIDLVPYDPFSIDKTGFSLSALAIQAIWNALTADLITANSVGKAIVDGKAESAAIKAQTDQLSFSSANRVDARVRDADFDVTGYVP